MSVQEDYCLGPPRSTNRTIKSWPINLSVSHNMRFVFTIVLMFLGVVQTVYGEENEHHFYGYYTKKHSERFYGEYIESLCKDKGESCYFGQVTDEVRIKPSPQGKLKVSVNIVGENDHSCSAEGEANFKADEIILLLPPMSNEEGICTVSISKQSNNTLKVSSSGPPEICNQYCGARAHGFDVKGLRLTKEVKATHPSSGTR